MHREQGRHPIQTLSNTVHVAICTSENHNWFEKKNQLVFDMLTYMGLTQEQAETVLDITRGRMSSWRDSMVHIWGGVGYSKLIKKFKIYRLMT